MTFPIASRRSCLVPSATPLVICEKGPSSHVECHGSRTAVCRLPIEFRHGKVSAIDLVRRSGYVAARHDVTVDRLADCLATDPDFVDAWLKWSEDNRSTPAWYIKSLDTGAFEVGYFDHGRTSQAMLDDRIRACAEYVRHYVEQFA